MVNPPNRQGLSLFGNWAAAETPDGRASWRQTLPQSPIRGALGADAMGPYSPARPQLNYSPAPWARPAQNQSPIPPDSPLARLQSKPQPAVTQRKSGKMQAQPVVKWWEGVSLPGDVNWGFLNERENFNARGYVPRDQHGVPVDQSAVTIGAGVDLGQHSEAELRGWGVNDQMITRLRPWLKGARPRQEQLRDANQLELTPTEAADLTRRSATADYNGIAQQYNQATGVKQRFEDLPQEMQTVVLSVAHQYGPNLPVRTPSFWHQATTGQWQDAYNNLMNFHDKYTTRRKAEAGLLKRALDRQKQQ